MKATKKTLAKSSKKTAKQNIPLLGGIIVPVNACDTCPREKQRCKKLILADNSHICVSL